MSGAGVLGREACRPQRRAQARRTKEDREGLIKELKAALK